MMRNAGKLMMVVVALFSTASWAAPLALWVGQSSFLGFPGKGSRVEVSDTSVIEVVTSKSGAEIRAKHPGMSQVTLRLRDGETHEFTVHVTSSGSEVYSVSRAEPEHSGFSLSSTPPARTSGTAQARKASQGGKELRTAERDAKTGRPRA